MEVNLTFFEVYLAAQAGAMRRIEAIKKGRPDKYGEPSSPLWDVDIESCCAEMAVAKTTGFYWSPAVNDPKTLPGDVGPIQVRSTSYKSGHLLLHKADDDAQIFVLAIGRSEKWNIAGWLHARDGKKKEYWREDVRDSKGKVRPAFFVPQTSLNQFPLPNEVYESRCNQA